MRAEFKGDKAMKADLSEREDSERVTQKSGNCQHMRIKIQADALVLLTHRGCWRFSGNGLVLIFTVLYIGSWKCIVILQNGFLTV